MTQNKTSTSLVPTWTWQALPAAAAVCLALALLVDRPLVLWLEGIHQAGGAWYRPYFAPLTFIGDSSYSLVPSGVVALVLLALWKMGKLTNRAGQAWLAGSSYVFVVVATSGIAVNLLKALFGRTRPRLLHSEGIYGWLPFRFEGGFDAFPSGHTTTAFALAGALALLFPRWRWLLLATAGLVGASRVVMGSHYPADVLAGLVLGLWFAALWRNIYRRKGWWRGGGG